MAKQTLPSSEIDRERLNRLMKASGANRLSCPACRQTREDWLERGEPGWAFLDSLLSAPKFPLIGNFPTTTESPLVALVCKRCGFVSFFHAIIMGLFDVPDPE